MSTPFIHAVRTALLAAGVIAASVAAQAQTTLILDGPASQVSDVMIQAGASANRNFNDSAILATRASGAWTTSAAR